MFCQFGLNDWSHKSNWFTSTWLRLRHRGTRTSWSLHTPCLIPTAEATPRQVQSHGPNDPWLCIRWGLATRCEWSCYTLCVVLVTRTLWYTQALGSAIKTQITALLDGFRKKDNASLDQVTVLCQMGPRTKNAPCPFNFSYKCLFRWQINWSFYIVNSMTNTYTHFIYTAAKLF